MEKEKTRYNDEVLAHAIQITTEDSEHVLDVYDYPVHIHIQKV